MDVTNLFDGNNASLVNMKTVGIAKQESTAELYTALIGEEGIFHTISFAGSDPQLCHIRRW